MFNFKSSLIVAAVAGSVFLGLTACGQSPSTQETAPEPTPVAQPATKAPEVVVATASFEGRSDHVTVGTAKITGTAGNYQLVFAGDFSLDGAPDPVVGFGKNGTYDPATKLASLSSKDGAQTYALPASFDPSSVGEVYVWCEQFDVPLGVASFETDFVAKGTFEGRSDHITTGTATITGTKGNYSLVFAGDFSLDGAPDPVVGFGKDGTYDPSTRIGSLAEQTGEQSYSLPADFDPASVNEVYVWCDQFSVPLGVATL